MPLQMGDTTHEATKADEFATEVLEKIETLSLEVADIAGTIDGLAKFVRHQEDLFAHLKSIAHTMAEAIRSIDAAGQETRDVTAQAACAAGVVCVEGQDAGRAAGVLGGGVGVRCLDVGGHVR